MYNKLTKKDKKLLILWFILIAAGALCWSFGLKKRILAMLVVAYGLTTHAFSLILGVTGSWIGSIPVVGPLILKVIMWPFFVSINALAFLVNVLRIKKDKPSNQSTAQAIATVLTIGIIIGYLLSKVF